MERDTLKCWAVLAISLVVVLLQSAPKAAADEDDPPSRVARLNYSQGSVSFQPAGEAEWVTAVPNRPLITGDTLWVDRGSRTELHAGSTAIRLNQDTEITLLELSDHVTQVRLAQGSMVVRIRHLDDEDAFEVDTPNLAFSPLGNGDYRIDVNPQGAETIITVRQGRGEVTGGGQNYHVLAGQQVRFRGTGPLDFDIEQIARADAFSDWCLQRDLREDRAESANYVSREMTGYEDLDDYGQWRYVANYGPVWVPAGVPVGWAPYRFGHWVWIQPWGWTWVEDEPWGFAPFHYGRWAYAYGFWCWVPGPVVVRPVYAPARVAFVGGGGFRFAVGTGIGWFPLAPGEVYVPAYRTSRVYVNNINTTNTVVNVTKITNVYNYYSTEHNVTVNRVTYVNQHVTNAVTAVSHETFVNARPVAKNSLQVSRREIEEAPLSHVMPVGPARASVVGAGRPTKALPPQLVVNRPVVAKRSAPPLPVPSPEKQVVERPAWGAPHPVPPENRPQGVTPPPHPPATERSEVQDRIVLPERAAESRAAEMKETAHPAPAAASRPPEIKETPHPAPVMHPLVRPAPPVEAKSQQQWQQEEQKNRDWQQQREKTVTKDAQRQPQQPRREDHPR